MGGAENREALPAKPQELPFCQVGLRETVTIRVAFHVESQGTVCERSAHLVDQFLKNGLSIEFFDIKIGEESQSPCLSLPGSVESHLGKVGASVAKHLEKNPEKIYWLVTPKHRPMDRPNLLRRGGKHSQGKLASMPEDDRIYKAEPIPEDTPNNR